MGAVKGRPREIGFMRTTFKGWGEDGKCMREGDLKMLPKRDGVMKALISTVKCKADPVVWDLEVRPVVLVAYTGDFGRTEYWADRITGSLYIPATGECLSSDRRRIVRFE